MKTASTAFLAILVISSVGIWGCAQTKTNAQARKIRDLEARYVKLEEDYRTVVAMSENARKKVARLEMQCSERDRQIEDLKVVVQERDDLKQKLAARTTERDNAHSQLVQFSKDLQSFATRVETVANAQVSPQLGTPVGVPNPKAD